MKVPILCKSEELPDPVDRDLPIASHAVSKHRVAIYIMSICALLRQDMDAPLQAEIKKKLSVFFSISFSVSFSKPEKAI
jgi:hypothetical protein